MTKEKKNEGPFKDFMVRAIGIYPRSQIRMEIICRSNDKHFAPEWKEFGSTWGVSDIDCPPAGRKKNHPLDGGDAYFKKKKVRVK